MDSVNDQFKEIGFQPQPYVQSHLDDTLQDSKEKVENFAVPLFKEINHLEVSPKKIKDSEKEVKEAQNIDDVPNSLFRTTLSSSSFSSNHENPNLLESEEEDPFQEQNFSSQASTSTTSSVSNTDTSSVYYQTKEFFSTQSNDSNTSITTTYTYSRGEELTFTPLNPTNIQALGKEIATQVKEVLRNAGIDLDKDHLVIDRQSVQEQATKLKNLMPKIDDRQLLFMSAFIEQNREKLKVLAQQYDSDGIYIRREISDLPLSLLVTPEGQFIWETKKKARDEALMSDSFKKLYRCVDHDKLQLYVSGTMSLPYYEGGMTLLKPGEMVRMRAAGREIIAGKAMRGLPHVAQTVHVMTYRAKPTKSKTPQGLQLKIKIIMDYYPKGDLKYLMTKNIALSEQQKEHIVQSLVDGILAIHGKGWIHGDIKPGNIFFDQNLSPYIGDFGCTHLKSELLDAAIIAHCHPDYYMAQPQNKLNLQERQDMFALGLTLAQMELNLSQLFWDNQTLNNLIQQTQIYMDNNSLSNVANFIRDGIEKLYKNFPEQTKTQKLIKKLINPELSKIPTAVEIKSDL